jgi:TRAP-type C4-dicarboxylate transport system permease large subunit
MTIHRRSLLAGLAAAAALGTIHPPDGVVLFITSRTAEISFETMSRAVLPWLVPLPIVLGAIRLWPPLTTFLPNAVMGR